MSTDPTRQRFATCGWTVERLEPLTNGSGLSTIGMIVTIHSGGVLDRSPVDPFKVSAAARPLLLPVFRRAILTP
jgi:hypothetical protein